MMRARHLGLGAVLAVALGASLVPQPEATATLVGGRRDAWQPPPVPMHQDDLVLASALVDAPFWGAKATAVASNTAALEDKRWRVAAVFRSAEGGSAWIEFGAPGKPPQRLRVGDVLPTGHRIVEIGERDICVAVGKKTLRMGVERAHD